MSIDPNSNPIINSRWVEFVIDGSPSEVYLSHVVYKLLHKSENLFSTYI